jgi:DNA (cytosine-5)-methyltransferase 1
VDDARWSESYWHLCRDGKHRRVPVEPTLFPLVDGGLYVVPGMARRRTVRPALLHGAGNAIVPQVAAEFIQAYLETLTP